MNSLFANPAGFIERSSIESEMKAAAKHIEDLDACVIVNDLTNYLRSGDLTVNDAIRTGSAHARLSKALAIDVFDSDIMSERGLPKSADFHNPLKQNEWAQIYSNIDHTGVFSPNQAPYSIFPLSPDQRVDLMTGRILILTYVNVSDLIRSIRRRGLWARLPTKAEMDALPNEPLSWPVPRT